MPRSASIASASCSSKRAISHDGSELIADRFRRRMSVGMTTTVDQKGSVAIPDEILRDSDVHPGDELEVVTDGGAIILRKASESSSEGLLDVLRRLRGLPLTDRQRSHGRHPPSCRF